MRLCSSSCVALGLVSAVERQYITKLPEVPELFESDTTIVVKDSKEGWAKAFRQLLALLWAGEIPKWDVSKVRPAGARLKTFGGRASGPAPTGRAVQLCCSNIQSMHKVVSYRQSNVMTLCVSLDRSLSLLVVYVDRL